MLTASGRIKRGDIYIKRLLGCFYMYCSSICKNVLAGLIKVVMRVDYIHAVIMNPVLGHISDKPPVWVLSPTHAEHTFCKLKGCIKWKMSHFKKEASLLFTSGIVILNDALQGDMLVPLQGSQVAPLELVVTHSLAVGGFSRVDACQHEDLNPGSLVQAHCTCLPFHSAALMPLCWDTVSPYMHQIRRHCL